jgi:hypothetical protein
MVSLTEIRIWSASDYNFWVPIVQYAGYGRYIEVVCLAAIYFQACIDYLRSWGEVQSLLKALSTPFMRAIPSSSPLQFRSV